MLKPMKKIQKNEGSSGKQEEFEHQDAFLETSYEAEHYIERNIELFKKYGLAAALLIALVIGYLNYTSSVDVEANGKFGMAMVDFTTGNIDKAKIRFSDLKDNYSGSAAAERAKYFLGKILLDEGLNEAARAEFQSYSGSDALIKPAVISALALTYENDKDYTSAAKLYKEASDADIRTEVKINYAIAAAVNFELAKNSGEAKSIYESLLADHKTFAKKSLVEQKIAML